MPSPSRLCALLVLAVAVGCEALDKPAWIATKEANDAEASYYAEEAANGRLYVIGRSATLQAFKLTGEIPYVQTFIGRGPNGETVVIEADAKDLALQARLRRAFEERHALSLR